MEFEEKLREKIRKQVLDRIEQDFQIRWKELPIHQEILKDKRFENIENTYGAYMEIKMGNIPTGKLYKVYDEFEEAISSKALMEMREKVELEEREKAYIQYKTLEDRFNQGRCNSTSRGISKKSVLRKAKRRRVARSYADIKKASRRR